MSEARDGMGALPHDDGVAFRVWAPHAEAVAVVGDFNDWDDGADPLTSEENGYWYLDVPAARPGHEYKFLVTHEGERFYRMDPYARQVTNSVGNGVIHDHGAFDWGDDDFTIAPHNELVIYELHIGSFAAEREDAPGTFELVASRLDHLVELGVNAVQVMPIMEFAGDRSWGYNPAHIFAVETSYGGPDGFKRLVRECHSRGMAVILDVVYNHFGPSDLDLWRFDGWSENDKGGIYFYNDHRSQTPWGDTRPDYGREEVRRYIHDNAMMWLHDYRVDGLRFDMTPFMRSVSGSGRDIPEGWDLMRWVNLSVREQYPGRIMIAEDMHRDPDISRVDDAGAAFHAQWDGAFVHTVRHSVVAHDDAWRPMGEVAAAILQRYNGDAFQRVVYTESHDEVANGQARVPQEVNPDDPTGEHAQRRSTLGAALVMTSPGIPMIFQGQEFLQGEFFRDDVPLDWSRNDDFRGIVRMYRDLIAVRRNLDGRTRGLTGQGATVFHVNEDDNVLAFHRWSDGGPGDDVVVVVNMAWATREGYRIGLPFPGRWELVFNSDATVYSDAFSDHATGDMDAFDEERDGMPHSGMLDIGSYSVMVFARTE